jgi:hypothetical protein
MLNKYYLKFQILLCIVICSDIQTVQAQNRWNVEIRPSVGYPFKVTSNLHKNVGFGIEGKTGFDFTPALGTYFGWGWNMFAADNRSDFSFEETGFTFGMQYKYTGQAQPGYFVAAGAVYNHIEIENREHQSDDDMRHRLGWQLESGVLFRLSPKLLVKPGLRYRNLHAAGLQYFSIGTGFSF